MFNNKLKSRWICNVCLKSLSSKRSYDEHMNVHTNSRPFGCPDCDYASASQMTLRRHRLRNHIPRHDWGYQCPYCGEFYMEPASYQQHVQSKHIGLSATFGCPFGECPFTTMSSRHFREHMSKHNAVFVNKRPNKGLAYGQLEMNIVAYLINDEIGRGSLRRTCQGPCFKVLLRRTDHGTSQNEPTTRSSKIVGIGHVPVKPYIIVDDEDFFKTPITLNIKPPKINTINGRPLKVIRYPSVDDATSTINIDNLNKESHHAKDITSDLDMDQFINVVEEEGLIGSEWIETEVVIDDSSENPKILPDGQIDIDLD